MSAAQSWWRAYGEMVDDAKLRLLAFEDRWHFVALCCCKCQGLLDETRPELLDRVVGLKLGLDSRALDEVRRRLMEVELVDKQWQPLGWGRRQFVSDTSVNRTREWRARKSSPIPPPEEPKTKTETDTEGDVTSDVTVTSPQRTAIGTPSGLNSEAFERWEQYARVVGKTLNDFSRPAAMRRLVSFGNAEQQAAVVEYSIANGWKTLNPIRDHGKATNGRRKTRFEELTEGRATTEDDDDPFEP